MERILIIEDHRAVQKALTRLFQSEGYSVLVAADGNSGLELFRATSPSLVVLDLRLPGASGEDVCRTIKNECPSVSVIVLSAKADVADKVLLLEIGADDYVTKPFSPRELLARVHVALRRSNRAGTADRLSFGDVSVDFASMEAMCGGRPVTLTALEFKVLKYFAQHPRRVVSRHELLEGVWEYKTDPISRTVDSHMKQLRQKLEKDPTSPVHFRTIHGAGYKFVP
jgi:DNA-binding response OmpR family regulator